MKRTTLPFLARVREARLEAQGKAIDHHRHRKAARRAAIAATAAVLQAELRRAQPRKAGRFAPAQPAPAGDDLFAGA